MTTALTNPETQSGDDDLERRIAKFSTPQQPAQSGDDDLEARIAKFSQPSTPAIAPAPAQSSATMPPASLRPAPAPAIPGGRTYRTAQETADAFGTNIELPPGQPRPPMTGEVTTTRVSFAPPPAVQAQVAAEQEKVRSQQARETARNVGRAFWGGMKRGAVETAGAILSTIARDSSKAPFFDKDVAFDAGMAFGGGKGMPRSPKEAALRGNENAAALLKYGPPRSDLGKSEAEVARIDTEAAGFKAAPQPDTGVKSFRPPTLGSARAREIQKGIQRLTREHPDWQTPQIETAIGLMSQPEALAGNLGAMVPYMAGTTAAMLAGGASAGPGLAFLVGYAVEGDGAYHAALADGATEDQARLTAAVYGTAAGLLEQAQVGNFLKFGKDAAKTAATKQLSLLMRTKILAGKGARLAATEGLQEMTQGAAQDVTGAIVYNKKQSLGDFMNQRSIEGLLGAIAGLGGGGVSAGVGMAVNKATGQGAPPVGPSGVPAPEVAPQASQTPLQPAQQAAPVAPEVQTPASPLAQAVQNAQAAPPASALAAAVQAQQARPVVQEAKAAPEAVAKGQATYKELQDLQAADPEGAAEIANAFVKGNIESARKVAADRMATKARQLLVEGKVEDAAIAQDAADKATAKAEELAQAEKAAAEAKKAEPITVIPAPAKVEGEAIPAAPVAGAEAPDAQGHFKGQTGTLKINNSKYPVRLHGKITIDAPTGRNPKATREVWEGIDLTSNRMIRINDEANFTPDKEQAPPAAVKESLPVAPTVAENAPVAPAVQESLTPAAKPAAPQGEAKAAEVGPYAKYTAERDWRALPIDGQYPWQMTKAEFAKTFEPLLLREGEVGMAGVSAIDKRQQAFGDEHGFTLDNTSHIAWVRRGLEAGETIPPEVLAEYPDLAQPPAAAPTAPPVAKPAAKAPTAAPEAEAAPAPVQAPAQPSPARQAHEAKPKVEATAAQRAFVVAESINPASAQRVISELTERAKKPVDVQVPTNEEGWRAFATPLNHGNRRAVRLMLGVTAGGSKYEYVARVSQSIIGNVKSLLRDAPEFAIDPAFTVNADKKLVFHDGYTLKFEPEVFGVDPAAIESGQRVGVDLGALGIDRAKWIDRAKKVAAKGWPKGKNRIDKVPAPSLENTESPATRADRARLEAMSNADLLTLWREKVGPDPYDKILFLEDQVENEKSKNPVPLGAAGKRALEEERNRVISKLADLRETERQQKRASEIAEAEAEPAPAPAAVVNRAAPTEYRIIRRGKPLGDDPDISQFYAIQAKGENGKWQDQITLADATPETLAGAKEWLKSRDIDPETVSVEGEAAPKAEAKAEGPADPVAAAEARRAAAKEAARNAKHNRRGGFAAIPDPQWLSDWVVIGLDRAKKLIAKVGRLTKSAWSKAMRETDPDLKSKELGQIWGLMRRDNGELLAKMEKAVAGKAKVVAGKQVFAATVADMMNKAEAMAAQGERITRAGLKEAMGIDRASAGNFALAWKFALPELRDLRAVASQTLRIIRKNQAGALAEPEKELAKAAKLGEAATKAVEKRLVAEADAFLQKHVRAAEKASEATARPGPIRQAAAEIVAPTEAKVTTTESAMLKNVLKMSARDAAVAYRAGGKDFQDTMTALITEIEKNIPADQQGDFLRTIKNARTPAQIGHAWKKIQEVAQELVAVKARSEFLKVEAQVKPKTMTTDEAREDALSIIGEYHATVADLTAEEVNGLTEALKAVLFADKKMKLFLGEQRVNTVEEAAGYVSEKLSTLENIKSIEEHTPEKGRLANFLTNTLFDGPRHARRLGLNAMDVLWRKIAIDGNDKAKGVMKEAEKLIQAAVAAAGHKWGSKRFAEWAQERTDWKLDDGTTVRITRGEKLELVAQAHDLELRKKLVKNGIGPKKNRAAEYHPTSNDLNDLAQSLTPGEKGIVDAIFKWNNTKGRDYINEPTLALTGIEKAQRTDYHPSHAATWLRGQASEAEVVRTSGVRRVLEGSGLLKPRVAHGTPMAYGDIFSEFQEHASVVGNIYGKAVPIRDAMALLAHPDVKTAIRNKLGEQEFTFWERYFSAASGIDDVKTTGFDRFWLRMTGRIAGAKLVNLSSALVQRGGLYIAQNYIPAKYFSPEGATAGFGKAAPGADRGTFGQPAEGASSFNHGKFVKWMDEYSSILWWRYHGQSAKMFAPLFGTKEPAYGRKGMVQHFLELPGLGVSRADMKISSTIVDAARRQLQADNPNVTETEVARWAEEVIALSQNAVDAENHSGAALAARQSPLLAQFLIFQSQPNKIYNTVYEATAKAAETDDPAEKARLIGTAVRGAVLNAAWSVSMRRFKNIVIASGLGFAGFGFLVGDGDDKDKKKWSAWGVTMDMLQEMFSTVYGAGEAFRFLRDSLNGWNAEVGTMTSDTFNDAVRATVALVKVLAQAVSGEESASRDPKTGQEKGDPKWRATAPRALEQGARSIGPSFGVPMDLGVDVIKAAAAALKGLRGGPTGVELFDKARLSLERQAREATAKKENIGADIQATRRRVSQVNTLLSDLRDMAHESQTYAGEKSIKDRINEIARAALAGKPVFSADFPPANKDELKFAYAEILHAKAMGMDSADAEKAYLTIDKQAERLGLSPGDVYSKAQAAARGHYQELAYESLKAGDKAAVKAYLDAKANLGSHIDFKDIETRMETESLPDPQRREMRKLYDSVVK